MGSRRALEKAKATPENLLEAVKEIMKKSRKKQLTKPANNEAETYITIEASNRISQKKQSIQQPIHLVQIESTH